MERDLERLRIEALAAVAAAPTAEALEQVVTTNLGRRGRLSQFLKQLPSLPASDRPRIGQSANALKAELERAVTERRQALRPPLPTVDPTLPGERFRRGHLHPLTRITREVMAIWRSLGYDVHEGPELERDWFNFEGLNIPPDHPSRDLQDTFFIAGASDLVLRTHSSTVQLRALEHRRPPLRAIEIGRVYRHEATDAKHESMFTQCDGVAIDRHLTMAQLVATLRYFLRILFGPGVKMRVRPSYFPFVEPGIEMDMQWTVNGQTSWLELLGAGMVHPKVLQAMHLDPAGWSGFAFGLGLDRLMLLRYGIDDIRLAYRGEAAFLEQF